MSPRRRRSKLDILSARGIRTALASDAPNIRADIVVECTGKPASFELARKRVRPRGTIILKSSYFGQVSTDLASIMVNEITVLGSRCGPFAPALDLLARKMIDVQSLIHARYSLKDGLRAMEKAQERGC